MEITKETDMNEQYIKKIHGKGIYSYPFKFARSFPLYPTIQDNQTQILAEGQKIIMTFV